MAGFYSAVDGSGQSPHGEHRGLAKYWPRPRLWKVARLCENAMQIPHARLIDLGHPPDTETISCHALASGAYYELVSDPPANHTKSP